MVSLRRAPARLGLIGAGAFGTFALPHLTPFFDVAVHDPRADLARFCAGRSARLATLAEAAACPVVVLAVPLAALRDVTRSAAPHLRPGALVIDVCSVKVKPLEILREELPAGTRLVGTHPLFGPNSGRDGVRGLKVVVCGGGRDGTAVARFLGSALGLDVVRASPEIHDREMAYIQALSHLVARSLKGIGLPDLGLKTAAFGHLDGLMALVGDDSAALFDTIVGGNPYAPEILGRFVAAARALVEEATCGGAG